MSESSTGQVIASAAEVYEEFFVPALFQEWPPRLVEAARIRPGQKVLDVGCGTGVLAREVANRVGPTGSVAGLDLNEGMLAVARRQAPHIDWRQGRAEEMPLDTGSFDAVVSQFALMFFEDRQAAITEMVRVLRPGGRLAVAVWDRLENSPGYAALTGLLRRLYGDSAAESLHPPFALGDKQALLSLFAGAGLAGAEITTHVGQARFPSIDAWIYTEIKGWTLADVIDDAQLKRLATEAAQELQRFVTPGGSVLFDLPAHIVTAGKA